MAKHGRPLLSSSLPKSLQPTNRKRYRTTSFLIVPIFDTGEKKNRPLGAICATDRLNKIPFSKHDKDLLTFLAHEVGIALTNALLYEQATVDFLTGIYLRGYFFERLNELLIQVRQSKDPLSLLMLDLDYFKPINDNYGHQVGDVILKELGQIIRDSIREGDIAGRYGGEEFIILLKNTSLDAAKNIAERIRSCVQNYSFNKSQQTINLTISIGVTQYINNETANDLVLRADRALYQAKNSGRNRVC